MAEIVSGASNTKPGIVLGRVGRGGHRSAIELNGKVRCRVDEREDPISVGDLLATASEPGHAMRAADPHRAFGAVIGNARHLGALEQAVLLALVRPRTELGKEAYGRAILQEGQHRLDRDVAAGAVYANLDRLEGKGLVSSRLGPGTPVRGPEAETALHHQL